MDRRLLLVAVFGIAVLLSPPADAAGFFDKIKSGIKSVGDALKKDPDSCSSITGTVGSVLGYGTVTQAADIGCLVGAT